MQVQAPPIYCALRYLLQWLRQEKPLHLALRRDPSPTSVRDALSAFQVARSFPGIRRTNRVQWVLDALLDVESRTDLPHSERVVVLARTFKKRFRTLNLSAASKLLWLRKRRPYVVFDARVRNALILLGKKFDHRDYPQYVVAWHAVYAETMPVIAQACEALVTLPGVASSVGLSDQALRRLASQSWFQERVFDIYLWEHGGDG